MSKHGEDILNSKTEDLAGRLKQLVNLLSAEDFLNVGFSLGITDTFNPFFRVELGRASFPAVHRGCAGVVCGHCVHEFFVVVEQPSKAVCRCG